VREEVGAGCRGYDAERQPGCALSVCVPDRLKTCTPAWALWTAENEAMSDGPASRPGRTHLPWATWLACALAVAAAGLLALTDLAGTVMGSWDTPAPGLGWLKAGAIGQLGLALAAAAVLVAAAARPRWRRRAAAMAGAIIALEAGWFLLTRMLATL
jgi:hypothetical protein